MLDFSCESSSTILFGVLTVRTCILPMLNARKGTLYRMRIAETQISSRIRAV